MSPDPLFSSVGDRYSGILRRLGAMERGKKGQREFAVNQSLNVRCPLFVLRAGERCPQCSERTNAFALLASGLYDGVEDDTFNDFILLKDIEYLPKRFLALLTERSPGWRFDQEEPSDPPCLMNHCLRCGAKIADSCTHAEPGSAFYPTSPDECWNISMFLLPVEDEVSLVCGWSSGGLTDWLDYDQAHTWEALAADQSPML